MNVVFFNQNINQVKYIVSKNSGSIAFWYYDDLSTYSQLKKVINIDKIYLEENISSNFLSNYQELVHNIEVIFFPTISESEPIDNEKIFFYASNDTHIYLYKNILNKIRENEFYLYCKLKENASEAAITFNFENRGNEKQCNSDRTKSSVLVLANDWGVIENNLCNWFKLNRRNIIGIQESLLDFNPKDRRLMNCSFPVFQGLNSIRDVDKNGLICAVIGNPRFEKLISSDMIANTPVFINVNFTYGFYEEERQRWLTDVLDTCSDLNLDYLISQHPRDMSNLEGVKNVIKSGPGIVHDTIKNSCVVISRFSAVIVEAIALGRPAIYFNPHNEFVGYRFDPDNKVLFYATNREELKKALQKILASDYIFEPSDLLNFHLGNSLGGNSSYFIEKLIKSIQGKELIKQLDAYSLLLIYLKYIKLSIKTRFFN